MCNLTCSSKWRMWVYFWYVCFESFSMVKKTFDLQKVYPCAFVPNLWAIFELQFPKWEFISKVLKMFHFHSHNVLDLFLALVYSKTIFSFLCPSFGHKSKDKVMIKMVHKQNQRIHLNDSPWPKLERS
jgi:hypothetical protein